MDLIKRLFSISIFIILCSVTVISAQSGAIDSLKSIRAEKEGYDRALINQMIAQKYIFVDLDSAEVYITYLEEYLSEIYNKNIDAYIKKLRGYMAEQALEYEISMQLRRYAYELFKELGDLNEMGWTAMGIGITFFQLGNYDDATDYFIMSLSAFDKDDNKRGVAEIYNLLGAINYVTGHPDKALEYYNSSLELLSKIGEKLTVSKVYNNIGLILYEDKKYEEALEYYEDALIGFNLSENKIAICGVYGNMSLCYFEINQISKALEFIHKSRRLAISIGSTIDEIGSYVNLGSFHRSIMKLDSAKFYLDKALHLSTKSNIRPLLLETYSEISSLYAVKNDFKTAYEYQLKYVQLKDEIHQKESEVRIENLMISYEQKLKQNEIEQLLSEQDSHSLINRVFGALVVVTLGLLFILVYGYSSNRKKGRLLQEKNKLLITSNLKLVESETSLKKVIDDKDKLFTIIAHDLRNPIAAVSGFSELLFDNFEQLDDATRKEYVSQIIQGSTRTYELLENLLLWARSQMDSIYAKKTETNIRSLIEDSIVSVQTNVQRKDINLDISIKSDFTLNVDFEMMKAVIRNLITNAVKFSFPGGKVEIKCYALEKIYCIEIADHGIGMEPEIIKNLFEQNSGATTLGTLGESGSGLGLMICKDYTEMNGGKIEVSSRPGRGSVFTVCLPLSEEST